MTCIVGVIKEGHVWMAGDLMGSNGYTHKVYPDTKVFQNGEFIFGYCGSFRVGQILQYNWEQPPRMEGMTDREYLQLDVIESFRTTLANYGVGEFREGEHQGGNFLIGYRGGLYEMQPNFSILKNEDFASIGSGSYHADAALKVLTEDEDFDPAYVLQKAIQTASYFTNSVSEECTIVTTDVEAIERMEEEDKNLEQELEAMFEESLPKDKLETLDKSTLIRLITGEMEDEEFDSIFGDYDELPVDLEVIKITQDLSILKTLADTLQVKYSHNIGIEKLRCRILDTLDTVED